ncbi:MAG: GerAB/ArcD/ProY family transporter, partial [Nanoarchaeota archaeon]|nr:GerAB/ArcD/ProY family transporter [Nanoarchaeota archaeon]
MRIKFWEAVATMVGVIIGAGIFGIPYVVAKAGFLTGAFVILLLGGVVALLYLYLGEVVLRTQGNHQLTGYAERYLGRWGKAAMLFSMVFGLYGAMVAYLLGEGGALSAIFGGPQLPYTLAFFVIVSFLLYFGIETLEKSELVTVFLVLLTVFVIMAFTSPHIDTANLRSFDITKSFIPFGVVLFAYLGMVAVPEANEILGKDKKKLKTVLLLGIIIPIIIYLMFTLVVVGSIGLQGFEMLKDNERIAT